MTMQIEMNCPIGKLDKQNVRVRDFRERFSLECSHCGKFTITRTAAAIAEKKS